MNNENRPKKVSVRLSSAEMRKWDSSHYFYLGQGLGETALAEDVKSDKDCICAEAATVILSPKYEVLKRTQSLTTTELDSKLNRGF